MSQDEAKKIPDKSPKTLDSPKTEYVFVIFADSSPDKIIVLDDSGKWMPNIKAINIEMAIGKKPTCSCTMWFGYYKPSSPIIKTWPLRQAKSIPPEEFQSTIDNLQMDHSYLAE